MSDEKPKAGLGRKLGMGCLILVGLFVVLAILGAIIGGGDEGATSAEGSAVPAEASAPAVEVTARELAQAYENNEAAAQQQFGDVPLRVSGTVSGVQLDFMDKPFIVLEGTNMFMGPQAHLSEESQPQAASLSKGQQITVTCAGVGEVVGTPMLEDCSID